MLIFRIGDEKIYKKIKGFITKNKLYGVICGYKLEFKKKRFWKKDENIQNLEKIINF